jgi:hypothetical protein
VICKMHIIHTKLNTSHIMWFHRIIKTAEFGTLKNSKRNAFDVAHQMNFHSFSATIEKFSHFFPLKIATLIALKNSIDFQLIFSDLFHVVARKNTCAIKKLSRLKFKFA